MQKFCRATPCSQKSVCDEYVAEGIFHLNGGLKSEWPVGTTINRNRHSSKKSRKSCRPVCSGCLLAWSCRLGRNGSSALTVASTQQELGQWQGQARRWSASGDTKPEGQFSSSFIPTNASKKVRYKKQSIDNKRGDIRWIAAHQQSGMAA
jgi:hypothetical protein